MLFRSLKWSDIKNFKSELISEHKGDEAGIKSSTIKIEGDYVYGWLKAESGIHRLVRISPFDSGARRHTRYISVTGVQTCALPICFRRKKSIHHT